MEPIIRVKFQIIGEQITPDEISAYLGIVPSETWLMGDQIQGTGLLRKHNVWRLSTKHCQTYDLEEQVRLMMARILPHSREITQVIQKYSLRAEIGCDVDIVDEFPSIDLMPDLLSQLGELGVSLDIDLVLSE